MRLSLVRNPSDGISTIGKLGIDSMPFGYTLERPEVQIPTGTYPIELTNSLDLTCKCPDGSISHLLPLLDNVPGRSCIRIHGGNWPRDSEGCILIGFQAGQDMITESQNALEALMIRIRQAVSRGEPVTITIS
jgi:Family of unknown function (DUF5675)